MGPSLSSEMEWRRPVSSYTLGMVNGDKTRISSHQLDRTFLQQAAETQFSGRRLQAKDGIANNFA
jgi:hypothetical protein